MPRHTRTGEFSLYHVSSLQRPASLIAQAVGILARYGGSLWVSDPAYTFVQSDGTGAAFDGSDAGYVRDLCATYGPELVTNGTFSSGTVAPWYASNLNATLAVVDGRLVVTATSTTYAPVVQPLTLVVGKTYEFSCDYYDAPSGNVALNVQGTEGGGTFASAAGNAGTSGTLRFVWTATQASVWVGPRLALGGAVGIQGQFDNISVREIIGRPLFQATTGFKPKLKRVPKRLGPELVTNGDFASGLAGWTTNGGTSAVVAGEAEVTSGTSGYGTIFQIPTTKAGAPYLVTGKVRCGTVGSAILRARNAGLTTTLGSATVTSTTAQDVSFTFAAEGTQTPIQLMNNSATASLTSYVDNISVREVLEWGWAWVFDGADDVLASVSLPAVTDETVMVCATSLTSAGTARAPIGKRSLNNGLFIRREAGGSLNGTTMTGSGFGSMSLESPHTNFQPFVATVAAKSGATRGRLNGAQKATTAAVFAGWEGQLGVGSEKGAGAGTLWSGYIFAAAYAPAAIPDDELLIVERAMAQLGGVTI